MFTIRHARASLRLTAPRRFNSTSSPVKDAPRPSLQSDGKFDLANSRLDPEPLEFRPPFVFKASRFLTFTLIPGTLLYGIFFADFGDREHVFSPPRRWLARQKEALFSLSPEERELAKTVQQPEDTTNKAA